ncbi:MAG TPA: trigger factor [Salinivirgaceae bacterium]|nr:trigger factor [Salinivirgaceae bacterium]HQA76371.1 trigger factor [Salinivirgaceae bacterium]
MKVEINKIDDLNAELVVKITDEDYNPRIEKTLKEYRKNAQIPGFRKGMVPYGHIKRMYGNSVKVHEIQELVSESVLEYLKTAEVEILGDPLVNTDKTDKIESLDNSDDLNFVFDLGLRPQFEVNLSKRNKIPYYKIDITKEYIDNTIKNITERNGTLEDVEEIGENDMISCSLKQLDSEGKILEDGITNELTYIRIESIEDSKLKKKFVGKKKDERVIFNPKKVIKNTTEIAAMLKIEKEDVETLDCDFEACIIEIKRLKKAEINTELFDKVYPGKDIATEEQFREAIFSEIEQSNHYNHESKFLDTATKYLIEKIDPKLPEEFLKRWLVDTKKVAEDKIDDVWDNYRKMFQWRIIVDKIVNDNDVKIEENDVIERVKEEQRIALLRYNITDIPDETLTQMAMKRLGEDNAYNHYFSLAAERKVLELIKEIVNVEETVVSADDFFNK